MYTYIFSLNGNRSTGLLHTDAIKIYKTKGLTSQYINVLTFNKTTENKERGVAIEMSDIPSHSVTKEKNC